MPRELRVEHDGMKGDHEVHGCPKKYVTTEDFRPWSRERRREPAEDRLDITLLWALAMGQTVQS